MILQRRLFAEELEARLDELLLLRLRQRSGRKAAVRLARLTREEQEAALSWVGIAAQSSTDLGLLLAGRADEHVDELAEWARGVLAAHDRGGLAAARAALDAPVSKGLVAIAPRLEPLRARLSGFWQALTGDPLSIQATDGRARTDGETVWLPERLIASSVSTAGADSYLALLALLWAQLRFDTLGETELPAATGAQQYWLDLFEAMRLEARLNVELPGLVGALTALHGGWPAELDDARLDLARYDASVADSLRWAFRFSAAGKAPPDPGVLPVIDPAAVGARQPTLQATPQPARPVPPLRGAADVGHGETGILLNPLAGDAVSSAAIEVAAPPVPEKSDPSALPLMGLEPSAMSHPAGPGSWAPISAATETAEETFPPAQTPTATYDEWDYRRQDWRRDWCQVFEVEAPAGDPAWVETTRLRHAPLIRVLSRRFEVWRGEDVVHRRQPDGDDIDLDAQTDAHVDLTRGGEVSPCLYLRRRRTERSLAAMFMVDMSGSTKGWVNEAERESLVLMGEAIQALGDRWAIYGFSGWTRARSDIYRIKAFSERYDAAVQRRIAGIEARDYTRMGVAVRHLSHLLAAQPARHKLLVTISDGRPDDHGDEYRGRYGIEDTRHALLEARSQGIRSFCVTIDRHGADYLPQLYGPAHYVVLDDPRKLPFKVADIYRRLTRQ